MPETRDQLGISSTKLRHSRARGFAFKTPHFLNRELNCRAPLYFDIDTTYMHVGRQRFSEIFVVIALITVAAGAR